MGKETISTIKAVELIKDWNLWPRDSVQVLDYTNVSRMREALKNGYKLPPVIADKKSLRIVDGFHRTSAVLSVFGNDADIDVILREYESEKDIFEDAIKLNAYQGLPLSPKDRAHCMIKLRKYKVPKSAIADLFQISTARFDAFFAQRTAFILNEKNQKERVSLSYGARNFAGKVMTPEQYKTANGLNGAAVSYKIQILINSLKSEAIILDDKIVKKLEELRDTVDAVLMEVAV